MALNKLSIQELVAICLHNSPNRNLYESTNQKNAMVMWSQLAMRMTMSSTDPDLTSQPESPPILVLAALHYFGNKLVIELIEQMKKVCPNNRTIQEVLLKYTNELQVY